MLVIEVISVLYSRVCNEDLVLGNRVRLGQFKDIQSHWVEILFLFFSKDTGSGLKVEQC